jgi:hypothetical protein
VKLVLAMVALLLMNSACLPKNLPATTTPDLDLTPVTTPVPVISLISTTGEENQRVGSGKYLFVEYWTALTGTSPSGRCEHYGFIDFPTYIFSAGKLTAYFGTYREVDLASTKALLGVGVSRSGAVGSGGYSTLNPINSFPYDLPAWDDELRNNEEITIQSMDGKGAIVFEFRESNYSLAPGEEWLLQEETDSEPNCHTTKTYRITNYGLLEEEQLLLSR